MRCVKALGSALLLVATTLPPGTGHAGSQTQSTGWVTPTELKTFSNRMKAEHMMPIKVACKGDSRSTIIRDSMMINMTFEPNTEHRHWYWKWGSNFGRSKHNLLKKGWTLVSQSGFTRPKTGLYVPCGVFLAPLKQNG